MQVRVPPCMRRWANLKHVFADHTGRKPHGMTDMLEQQHLVLEGRHHCGLDDARNIARVVAALVRVGATLRATWH